MYIGPKYKHLDESDAVIQWSDNPGFTIADRMRFIFTSSYNPGVGTGMNSLEGLEAMRMWPKNGDEVNVGVGDFFAAGGDPTERFHIRDGRERIQQLPDDPECDNDYKVMVVDDSPFPSLERGVVKWVDPSVLNACGSGWSLVGTDACTAWDGNPCPPQDADGVGIGISTPAAKLHVVTDDFQEALHATNTRVGTSTYGASIEASGGTLTSVGLHSRATGATATNYGATLTAAGATGLNVGSGVFSLGAATDNQGIELWTNGATNSNIGEVGLVNGGATTNTGSQFVVSGATQANVGGDLTVSGAAPDNTGIKVAVADGTANTIGIDVVASGSGSSTWRYGVKVDATSGSVSRSRGVWAETDGATGSSSTSYAGWFISHDNAWYTHGIVAQSLSGQYQSYGIAAASTAAADHNFGVNGVAREPLFAYTPVPAKRTGVFGFAQSSDEAMVCYGVYGDAGGPDDTGGVNGHTKWAGYFPGYTYTPGSAWSASDEQLKQNIQDVQADVAVEQLLALEPKTYDFNQDEFAFMHLPTEHQIGLVAQNVESVLPNLVTTIHQPAQADSSNNELYPEVNFKAMNYQGLIPLLIAGFKAQQATIEEMQAQLDACCTAGGGGMAPNGGEQRSGALSNGGTLQKERLLISPNPFSNGTTISYYLSADGRARLEVSDASGRPMKVLREEETNSGGHTYEWNTTGLSSGTYFVIFSVNGQVVVKRAVKVNER